MWRRRRRASGYTARPSFRLTGASMSREPSPELRERIENTIRFLAVDAVEKAGCGHPGAPMGLARPAFELWDQHLRFDPSDPKWPLRDRFVLSNGHASMLLYSLAPSLRLRASARRDRALPPARLEDARASRVRRDARRRGDDGPARAGLRARRRHGARRPAGARPLRRGRRGAWTPSSCTESCPTAI